MFMSLFVSAFLATVMAQDSPLTTVTLGANAILGTVTPSSALPTITTNLGAALSTITLPRSSQPTVVSTSILPGVATAANVAVAASVAPSSSEPTVILTSIITSTVCGACTTQATGAVVVAAVASLLPSTLSTTRSTSTASGIPYGGSAAFPVSRNNLTSVNGTVIFTGTADMLSAGSVALTAGLLAASYFALVL